jgi:uncharacterized protein with PIN domain
MNGSWDAPRLRFLADVNVGRLGKWLRALGYDVLPGPCPGDAALLALAEREGRVLLTRDRRLTLAPQVRGGAVRLLLVRSERLPEQLREVLAWPGLDPPRPFTRCLLCNSLLAPAPPEAVEEHVPPYVRRSQAEFRQCPSCRRVYWRGSHWRRMHRLLASLLSSVSEGL